MPQSSAPGPLFQHELFRSIEFQGFKQQLAAGLAQETPPAQVRLETVMPDISEEIRGLRQEFGERLSEIHAQNSQLMATISNAFSGRTPIFMQIGVPSTNIAQYWSVSNESGDVNYRTLVRGFAIITFV